jgi:hypothetical protein
LSKSGQTLVWLLCPLSANSGHTDQCNCWPVALSTEMIFRRIIRSLRRLATKATQQWIGLKRPRFASSEQVLVGLDRQVGKNADPAYTSKEIWSVSHKASRPREVRDVVPLI